MPLNYQNPGPTREEIDATTGPVVLDFGFAVAEVYDLGFHRIIAKSSGLEEAGYSISTGC